ncbi:MAG: hypothetical protein LUE12_00135 [Ruminococcus sp.]|nr:hypothetical protein [Ruminococcus sp.]
MKPEMLWTGEFYPLAMPLKPAFMYIMSYAEQQSGKSFFDDDANSASVQRSFR